MRAVAQVLGRPEWRIVGEAFEAYWKTVPPRDRKLALALVKARAE